MLILSGFPKITNNKYINYAKKCVMVALFTILLLLNII